MQDRIIFMGTSDFAVPILEQLALKTKVLEVVSQPDRKVGRKQELQAPPVKEKALKHDLCVYQPEKLKSQEVLDHFQRLKPELIVVAAYGQLLPAKILEIPTRGCLNVHASLLPKYRGASPIQAAILQGEQSTGVSIMLMDEGLDTGDVVRQVSVPIEDTDDYQSLESKLAIMGADLLLDILQSGNFSAIKQAETDASFTSVIEKADGLLDFHKKTALELERQIRAFSIWPQSFLFWNGKRLKILKARAELQFTNKSAGTNYLENGVLKIACKQGSLQVEILQLEGKQPVTSHEFLNGHATFAQTKL
jgi:methionyl-tRNA formyltransferase